MIGHLGNCTGQFFRLGARTDIEVQEADDRRRCYSAEKVIYEEAYENGARTSERNKAVLLSEHKPI